MLPQKLVLFLAVALGLSGSAHGFSPSVRLQRGFARLHAAIPLDVVIPAGPSVPCAIEDVQIVHTSGNVNGESNFWMRRTVPGDSTQK